MTNQNPYQVVTYESGGQEITLTPDSIKQFITKGNGDITYSEAVNFMMLCKGAGLNPFLNEAYLIKFGTSPAQMVTSKEAILKRASRQPDYEGMVNGIVTIDKEGNVNHKKGTMIYPNEQLLGGWAEVNRGNFKNPVYAEVALNEFSTGKSTWNKMPANMINKVAQNKALREAYPEELGGMYTEEEPAPYELNDVTPTDNQGEPLTFEHKELVEEPEDTIEDKIKDLRKYIRENSKDYKTHAKIDKFLAETNGIEDASILNEQAVLSGLLLLEKKINSDKQAAEVVEEVELIKEVEVIEEEPMKRSELFDRLIQLKNSIAKLRDVEVAVVDQWIYQQAGKDNISHFTNEEISGLIPILEQMEIKAKGGANGESGNKTN